MARKIGNSLPDGQVSRSPAPGNSQVSHAGPAVGNLQVSHVIRAPENSQVNHVGQTPENLQVSHVNRALGNSRVSHAGRAAENLQVNHVGQMPENLPVTRASRAPENSQVNHARSSGIKRKTRGKAAPGLVNDLVRTSAFGNSRNPESRDPEGRVPVPENLPDLPREVNPGQPGPDSNPEQSRRSKSARTKETGITRAPND
jgi:hypothetical protein